LHDAVGEEVCQHGKSGMPVSCTESSLWPAMSFGKSVVLNYLISSSEHTQPSTVGQFVSQCVNFAGVWFTCCYIILH